MFNAYSEYKKSGLPWLDVIPAHWDEIRTKGLYQKENRPILKADDIVTCFRDGVVTLRKNRRTSGFTESLKEIGYQGIKKGDLVIHAMDAFAGAIGVSDSDGKGTPVYNVCTARKDINNYYYAHIVREMARRGFIQSLYRGIRERSSDFRFETFAKQYLPVPPLHEQDQIVRFLDSKLSKIAKLINAKKKQIALLKEQKQAIINKAVTKGLDPDAKMKPSGVEWLGDIPEGWEVFKLKHLAKSQLQYGANESGTFYAEGNVRYIRITDITSDGKLKTQNKTWLSGDIAKEYLLKDGDILLARSGGTVGKTFLFKQEYGTCCFAGYLIKYSPNLKKVIPEYIYNFTMSGIYDLWLNKIFIQSTIQNVSAEKYKELLIAVPSIQEQQKIVLHIEQKSLIIDKAISGIEKEISLISEYKARLISDVVTGKIDVRGVEVADFDVELAIEIDGTEEIESEEVLEEESL